MISGFKPIVSKHSKVLILGSMPSVVSLEKQEYYGFKHNRFWKIMSCFSNRTFTSYEDKKQMILDFDLALWDVIDECEREGSLDSKIKKVRCNPINELLIEYPNIQLVICNGKKAGELYMKHFKDCACKTVILPSTSNANRSISEESLFAVWIKALKGEIE